ncbi:hypothetical protein B4168_3695 [Anoxybacillus flavithermus]|nr:hypothetical protein B4168_3695 [Anoxybacillus flavithermus]OAO88119.1 hypothetical protein GT23_0852 [Parageobacillus thermoglucosidasius]
MCPQNLSTEIALPLARRKHPLLACAAKAVSLRLSGGPQLLPKSDKK